ncbi:MAG: hypothetical protein QOG87_2653 [Actinomycetota bacterium]
MGILDDAIRQHLELKRKHGVPEDELERQEEEALGPARRQVAEQPEEEAEATAGQTATAEADRDGDEPSSADEETSLFDMENGDEASAQEPEMDQPPGGMEPPPVEPTPEEPPPVEPTPEEPTPEEIPPVAPIPDEEPAAPTDASDAVLGDTVPHGFDAIDDDDDVELAEDDDVLVSDPEDEDLDVLEDTPDFLQETPEHDRLWFEQKPPRDFDFD